MKWVEEIMKKIKVQDQSFFLSKMGEQVLEDLVSLGKEDLFILKNAINYVLKGEPVEVLLKLRNDPKYSKALKLSCVEWKRNGRQIFRKIDPTQPACYLRLLQVYEAAALGNPDHRRRIDLSGVSFWMEILIDEATGYYGYSSQNQFPAGIDYAFVEQLLQLADEPREMLVRIAFLSDAKEYSTASLVKTICSLKGFHLALSKHQAVVLEALNHGEARQRIQALEILYHDQVELLPWREKLIELACGSAKTVREVAQKIILNQPEIFRDSLAEIVISGDASSKQEAIRLYVLLAPREATELYATRLEVERAPKVVAALKTALATLKVTTQTKVNQESKLELAPLAELELITPLSEGIKEILTGIIQKYNQIATEHNEKRKHEKWFAKMKLVDENTLPKVFVMLENLVVEKETRSLWQVNFYQVEKEWQQLMAHPDLQLLQLLRLLIISGELHWKRGKSVNLGWSGNHKLQYFLQTHESTDDLRKLALGMKTIGIETTALAWYYFEDYYTLRKMTQKPELYWMYYAGNQEVLAEILGITPGTHEMRQYGERERRQATLRVLGVFPEIPLLFQVKLWELALEGPKHERGLAQVCLAKLPETASRVVESLKDGRQEVRTNAARWLKELHYQGAVPELKQALKKEKNEHAKGAMMEALESLGVPVDEFLDWKSLKQEAEKGLVKGVPTQLTWFPFETLPELHCEDGKLVEPIILKWLIILACKLGSPEPTPALRKYAQYFKQTERRALGKYIVQAWLTQDTLPRYNMETALPVAKQQAQQYLRWYPDRTEEDLIKMCLNNLLNDCLGSATKEKGILAVAAVCNGAEVVPMVEAYLKKWYGQRLHQCKALIQMLAWNEESVAIQLLLSVANRFRTKGIQEQANQCVNELAERQGWTLDQLADRTIPTIGFDEKRTLSLDYGTRKFFCKINDKLEFQLFNEAGKELKNLPEAGKDDDPDLAKAAKKELSEAKKLFKQVLRLQAERLYENMCTQRTWKFSELEIFLFAHPIISNYCQRLVWVEIISGKAAQSFRLMEDGTLTDYEDAEVKISPETEIRLAHSCNLETSISEAWLAHFADYEIKTLFTQFGKESFDLAKVKNADDNQDYLGYLIDNFKLRGILVKLGYVRGQAEDGGFFYQYHKRFNGLKLEAIIEFSGVPLPEENVKVALKEMYFRQLVEQDDYNDQYKVSLSEIPAVLLSEIWNDYRAVALVSEGFDPNWEKKVAY